MKAIRIHETGGPEVLTYEDCPEPAPGPGQVLIDVQAIGVNFTDVGSRRGSSPLPGLPWVPGREAAGVVSAVGGGVTEVKVGELVAYCWAPSSYAQKVVAPAKELVKLPDGMEAWMAAAVMIQGLTAHYLVYSTWPIRPGDAVLVHAGAGGTGLMLIQIAKRAGAYVYATVSTDEKAAIAVEAGADRVIIYTRDDFEQAVKQGYGRPGSPGGLRRRGQDHLRQEPGMPGTPRPPGPLRPVQRPRGPLAPVQAGRLRVPESPRPLRLHFPKGGVALARGGGAGLGPVGAAQGPHWRHLPVVGCGGGPPAAGGAPLDWQAAANPVAVPNTRDHEEVRMKAVRIHETGGPEVLRYEDCQEPTPGPGEAIVAVQAIGVNFTDVQTRRGGQPS